MFFASDNTSGLAPEILQALNNANDGFVPSYGGDDYTAQLQKIVDDLFQTKTKIFIVPTGTASNCLALSALCPSYGIIYCHSRAHIEVDESSAPQFFTGGARSILIHGDNGKVTADALQNSLKNARTDIHWGKASALTLTNTTEFGTLYTPDEVSELCAIAQKSNLNIHMDGARFANALAYLKCHPADLSWRAGIDILSLGASKNGCLDAEILVCFHPELAERIEYKRKQSGHLMSKMRFVSAQLLTWFENDLWLDLAERANAQTTKLAAILKSNARFTILNEMPRSGYTNQLYIKTDEDILVKMEQAGVKFYRSSGVPGVFRFVTSFNTDDAQLAEFEELITTF